MCIILDIIKLALLTFVIGGNQTFPSINQERQCSLSLSTHTESIKNYQFVSPVYVWTWWVFQC